MDTSKTVVPQYQQGTGSWTPFKHQNLLKSLILNGVIFAYKLYTHSNTLQIISRIFKTSVAVVV